MIGAGVQPRAGGVSHNLVGQRLGRKGQETRERIVRAALGLLEKPGGAPVTLAAVAREAAVGTTTLYLYFPDLGELVLAALGRVMAAADTAFVDRLRARWPDEMLDESGLDFVRAHARFWQEHARILHLRNSFADAGDDRFLAYRNDVSRPLIDLLVWQMDGDPADPRSDDALFATVLLTGCERLATVVTNENWAATTRSIGVEEHRYVGELLVAEARLITLAIGERRRIARRLNRAVPSNE